MQKARKNASGKMAMVGNLNPAAIVLPLDASGVYQKNWKLCGNMKDPDGFILAPGCDLPRTDPEYIPHFFC